jgi:hypothetical protein
MARYGKEERKAAYDTEQAKRRTKEQNETIIDLISKNHTHEAWAYTSVPAAEQMPVILQMIPIKQWVIEPDGSYEEQPYPTAPSGL